MKITTTSHAPHASTSAPAVAAHDDSWFVTSDPRRLSLLFALVTGLALVAGSFLAAGLALRPLGAASGMGADDLRRTYTMHGLALVFLTALPAVPGIFGHAFLPRRLGVERLFLARSGLLSLHLLAAAVLTFAIAAVVSPADAGWSFDVPFALGSGAGLWLCGLGVLLCCASVVLAGANVVASVFVAGHERRERGLDTFSWALAVASLLAIVAALVLAGVLSILLAERGGLSDLLARGGAGDVRFATWFALAANAALGSIVLGLLGLVSEIVEGARGEPRPADALSIGSLVALSVLALVGFGMHVPGRESVPLGAVVASALALLSGVPLVVFVSRWWSVLADGTVRLTPAVSWAIASVVCLAGGALSAVALGVLPTAVYLEHSSYASGVFHLVFAGAFLAAVFGGIHHAWRGWFGFEPASGGARFACFLFVVGTFLTFVPQMLLGWRGAVARGGAGPVVSSTSWGVWSAVGACVLAAGLVATGWNLLNSWIAEREEARR